MKKTISILICVCAASVLFAGTWGLSGAAYSARQSAVQLSQTQAVDAFESEENYTPKVASDVNDEYDTDYEGTAIVGVRKTELPEPSELSKPRVPATGVEIAIIPAAIALIALIASFIIGKFSKKGKK